MEQSWIIAGGAGAVLLVAVVWILVRRRSSVDDDMEASTGEANSGPDTEIRLTEPTLEPLPEVSDTPDTKTQNAEATGQVAEDAPTDPVEDAAPTGDLPAETIAGGAESDETPELEPEIGAAAEAQPEPEPTPSARPDTEPAEASDSPARTDAPESRPTSDPAFLAARDAFERELLAGHFSRLDVFDAYARAKEGPNAPGVPRSEYFHRIVNEALETRDAFEALLEQKDRERFVDIHSRYLDDVTEEADAAARERLHHEHQEKLGRLRPKPVGDALQN